jgi:hypothetical protein
MLNKHGFGNYDKNTEQCFKLELETSLLHLSENQIFQVSLHFALFSVRPLQTP